MAYIVRNVDILDLKPSTGVGIALPFNGPTGINTTFTTKDAIKLLKIIENITDQIENLIYGGVETFFPQVQINTLLVELDPNNFRVTINLNYSVINTNIEDELQINFNTNGGV